MGPRNRWAPRTDEFHKLDLAGFERAWLERHRTGTLTWSCGERVAGCIGYRLAPDHMRLVYTSGRDDRRQDIDERFDLAFTDQPFGGQRMWIVCPSCRQRCRASCWFFGTCGSISAHCASLSQKRYDVYNLPTASRHRNHDLLLPINTLIGF